MKSIAVLAGVLVVGYAHASFDLGLLPDASGGIRRVDLQTGAMFGKFGGITQYSTALGTFGSKRAWGFQKDYNKAYLFDYSTGEVQLETLSNGGGVPRSLSMDSSTIVESNNPYLYRFGYSNLSYINGFSGYNNGYRFAELSSTQSLYWALGGSTATVQMINPTTGATVGTATSLTGMAAVGDLEIIPWSSAGANYVVGVGRDNSNNVKLYYGSVNSSNATLNMSTTLTGFSSTDLPTIVKAHNGFYVIGRDATNPTTTTRVQEFDNIITYSLRNEYTLAYQSPTGYFDGSTILAPEPGSWAALGLGAMALLRRRRK